MSLIATTLDEIKQGRGEIRAGGTDLMERYRHGVSKGAVIDISRIPDLHRIETPDSGARIGALVTIAQVAAHPELRKRYPGLSIAAGALATPQVRNAASMGGSLLQRTRCWYYRHEDFNCYKKGGDSCPARKGNHQFGVCFDLGPCIFPHPSTLGMVLMAYQAEVEVRDRGRRSMMALYGNGKDPARDHFLADGDVLTQIHLPPPLSGEKAAYFRSISRARAEWPLVEVVARYRLQDGKIADAQVAIGGVANVPLLLTAVSDYLIGKTPSDAVHREAGSIAARGAQPLPMTPYKVGLVEGTVFETLRRVEAGIVTGEG